MSGSTRALIEIILSIYSTLSSNTLRLMRELADHRQAEQSLLETQEELKAANSSSPHRYRHPRNQQPGEYHADWRWLRQAPKHLHERLPPAVHAFPVDCTPFATEWSRRPRHTSDSFPTSGSLYCHNATRPLHRCGDCRHDADDKTRVGENRSRSAPGPGNSGDRRPPERQDKAFSASSMARYKGSTFCKALIMSLFATVLAWLMLGGERSNLFSVLFFALGEIMTSSALGASVGSLGACDDQ